MTGQEDDVERLLTRYRPAGPPPRLRQGVVRSGRPRLWPFAAAAAALWLIAAVLYTRTADLQPVLPEHPPAHESLAQWLGGRPEDYTAAERLLATFDQDTRVAELRDAAANRTDGAWAGETNR